MKVLHVIPAAFHYYDDIQTEAFKLVDAESQMGVEAVAYTIEYQLPVKNTPLTEKEKKKDEPLAPIPAIFQRRALPQYKGRVKQEEIESDIESFDIIHVHVPIFGAIGKVLEWKKRFPKLRIFVSVHRKSIKNDFFTVLFALYNKIMLPKVFAKTECIIAPSMKMLFYSYKRVVEPYIERAVELDESSDFLGTDLSVTTLDWNTLKVKEILALKCIILYNSN